MKTFEAMKFCMDTFFAWSNSNKGGINVKTTTYTTEGRQCARELHEFLCWLHENKSPNHS